MTATDHESIASVVRTFFAAFTTGPGCDERMDALPELFLPTAVVVRTCGGEPTSYDVERFIRPRRELLTGGTVTDFREWEVEGRTIVFGDVAQHLSTYAKQWRQDGTEQSGRGVKAFVLVRTGAGWRIAGAAWDDERDGLSLDGWHGRGAGGYRDPMSTDGQDARGRVDDETEEREPSSTVDGPAAEGRADPTQGSPGSHAHPVAESYPDEVTRYDEPESRRTDPPG